MGASAVTVPVDIPEDDEDKEAVSDVEDLELRLESNESDEDLGSGHESDLELEYLDDDELIVMADMYGFQDYD